MDVEFADRALDRLESDLNFSGGFPREVVRSYRKLMQAIRAAPDERTFQAMKSLHFEKLKGDRDQQRSMRLNKQWRLIIEFRRDAAGKVVIVVSIEDYH